MRVGGYEAGVQDHAKHRAGSPANSAAVSFMALLEFFFIFWKNTIVWG
jgi:hypothetical protein